MSDPHPDGEETMPEGKWSNTVHFSPVQPGETVGPERWQATAGLRFVARMGDLSVINARPVRLLQQLWQSDSGKREWRDVAVETE